VGFSKADSDLENLIKKVILKVKTDPEAKQLYIDFSGDFFFELTTSRLENAAGNHAFDDHPEVFGITEHEGHCIRAYCQQNSGQEFRDYVQSVINSVV
jgi:hypothetical protein